MKDLITNPFFYTPIIGVIGAILGSWFTSIFALRRFHREKQYENKLDRYLLLVQKMRGFVKQFNDSKDGRLDREGFVESYRTIWMYGRASVVREISSFLYIVLNPPIDENEKKVAEQAAKKHLKSAVIEMRKDLKATGKLREKDFDIFV